MAYEIPGLTISLPASADLSAAQFLGVVVESDGEIAVAGDGVNIAGILQDKPAAVTRAGQVMTSGVSKGVLGATVATGANVATDAAGKFKTAASADYVVGLCLQGGDLNEIGVILLDANSGTVA